MTRLFLILAGLTFLYGCATVAVTGRKQLNLISNEELIPMAAQQYAEVMQYYKK